MLPYYGTRTRGATASQIDTGLTLGACAKAPAGLCMQPVSKITIIIILVRTSSNFFSPPAPARGRKVRKPLAMPFGTRYGASR